MRLLLIAVVSRLPSCSWESGGAVTVAMNMTGFTSPCAIDSNSAETLRSHIAESPGALAEGCGGSWQKSESVTETRFVKHGEEWG